MVELADRRGDLFEANWRRAGRPVTAHHLAWRIGSPAGALVLAVWFRNVAAAPESAAELALSP